MAKLQTDCTDFHTDGQFVDECKCLIQKSIFNCNIRIEKQNPVADTSEDTSIDSLGESKITAIS